MTPAGDPLELRQLLAGRDFARDDRFGASMANFAYAIADRSTGRALLVDPAYAPLELAAAVEADGLAVAGIVLTHYHADHAGGALAGHPVAGAAALLERYAVPVHVQRAEVPWVVRGAGLDEGALLAHDDGDTVELGEVGVTLLHTPGHTPGSQCLLVRGRLVTGDTLFIDGCGRTDLPGGDGPSLYESIVHRIGALPDATTVLPGHAYSPEPSASLGELRGRNPVLVPRAAASWLAAFTG